MEGNRDSVEMYSKRESSSSSKGRDISINEIPLHLSSPLLFTNPHIAGS